jgi:NAD(P)-dependent dehydrogenase (short-subunit alcohol dehydrogenase family)
LRRFEKADGGRAGIVLVASDRAFHPEPGLGPYGVAKAGVVHLAKVAAAELGAQGIRVNTICPGPTQTPMLGELPDAVRTEIASRLSLARLAEPQEIAEAIVFCARHKFMTGSAVTVDGGSSLAGRLGVREAMGKVRAGEK